MKRNIIFALKNNLCTLSGVKPKKVSYLDKYTAFQPKYKFSFLKRVVSTYPISFSQLVSWGESGLNFKTSQF